MDNNTQTHQVSSGDKEEYLTAQQIADQLRLRYDYIRGLLHDGRMPGYKVGRVWRVRVSEFEHWLAQRHNAQYHNETNA